MTDSEVRKQFLFLCNVMRDHLALTAKLESAVETLLSRDPSLKAHYDAAQSEEQTAANQRGDLPQQLASECIVSIREETVVGGTP